MKRTEKRVCDGSPESMHGAAGAPLQLTDGACVAAQSTDVAALRHILQARPLALRLHRERAIGAKSTDLCAVDLHVGRAQRADNRGSRICIINNEGALKKKWVPREAIEAAAEEEASETTAEAVW